METSNSWSFISFKKQNNCSVNCSVFCPTFIASSSPALATVKWPRNEDSKNGFSFAVERPEAEIIDFLCFDIILSDFLLGDVA